MLATFAVIASLASPTHAAEWRQALPGWNFAFPRDHGNHPDFKTEWWYFTGNLQDERGTEYGYQLTFFRQGIHPPGARTDAASRFVVDHIKFAHFAVSAPAETNFRFSQRISRGAFGEAGFEDGNRLAWIDEWTLTMDADGHFRIAAAEEDFAIELELDPENLPVLQGRNGVSQKADGAGNASHYYSLTRLATAGTLTLGGKRFAVTGESWFDHEWASNQLGEEQVGWDWLSIQLDDDTELMLYQIRLADGTADPNSSGTFVEKDGHSTHIPSSGYAMHPLDFWTSDATGARYPIQWRLKVPAAELALTVRTPMKNQELFIAPVAYWEGLIHVEGTRAGKPVKGHGYMELTGYAGPLVELKAP